MSSSPNGSLASVNGGGFMAFPAATTCLGAPTSEASGGWVAPELREEELLTDLGASRPCSNQSPFKATVGATAAVSKKRLSLTATLPFWSGPEGDTACLEKPPSGETRAARALSTESILVWRSETSSRSADTSLFTSAHPPPPPSKAPAPELVPSSDGAAEKLDADGADLTCG